METQQPLTRRKLAKIKLKESIRRLPDKKPHLDFLAAILTIPVLLTVLYLNFGAIQGKSTKNTLTPTPTPTPIQYRSKFVTPLVTNIPQPTTSKDCIKDIGPISISSPQENDTVTTNPVCISIDYQQGNYCSVVWAYKINDSAVSDYSNNSVCLYNLPQGNNKFTLSVKSLTGQSMKTLTRNFVYKGSTPTPAVSTTPASSNSGTLQ